jgi:uncharacterized membrane protein YphA (DoxX/SURF4 family)
MKRTTIIEIIVMLYVILFLYTGISKLMDYSVFKEQIATSPILAPVAKPIAWGLPWIEFFLSILLLVPRWRLKGLIASAVLMVLFTAYIILVLSFNKEIPCSCGGVIEQLSWGQHIVFNTLFIASAIIAIAFQKRIKKDNTNVLSSLINRDLGIQS